MKHFLQIYGTLRSQWSHAEPYPTSIAVKLPRALRSISAFIVSDQVLATHPPALCIFQHAFTREKFAKEERGQSRGWHQIGKVDQVVPNWVVVPDVTRVEMIWD